MLHKEIADLVAGLLQLWGLTGLKAAYWIIMILVALFKLIKVMRSEKDK